MANHETKSLTQRAASTVRAMVFMLAVMALPWYFADDRTTTAYIGLAVVLLAGLVEWYLSGRPPKPKQQPRPRYGQEG